jgi:TolB protein
MLKAQIKNRTHFLFYIHFATLFFFALCAANSTAQQPPSDQKPIALQARATEHARTPLLICVMEKDNENVCAMAQVLKRDFMFSEQFDVMTQNGVGKITKKQVKALFPQALFVLFLMNDAKNSVEWRLYDTVQGEMIKGQRYAKRGTAVNGWAHNIADTIWPLLTGNQGSFSTRIAYCKSARLANGKQAKHVYIAEYDGSNEQCLVKLPTVSIAPRWNSDPKMPLLFYSEYTNSNVRLVSVNMEKKRHVASNFHGINMLPAFSVDGKKVVYCASRDEGHCQLYYYDKNGIKKLTNNEGNNVSPTLSDDGVTVFYCSDFQTGSPQIYSYNIASGVTARITHDGYCASPSYCQKRKQIAYTKMMNGIMQVFMYDEQSQQHTQLTFDGGSKQECSWSACGNYILFSVERGTESRIAVLNLLTRSTRYITDAASQCSYPAWSPVYDQFPTVCA